MHSTSHGLGRHPRDPVPTLISLRIHPYGERNIVLHVMIPVGDISLCYQGTPRFPSFWPENGIGNAYIYYR